MKRFRFPLQSVAVLRAHRESQAQEALAVAIQTCERREEALAAVRQRVAGLGGELLTCRQARFDGAAAAGQATAYARECDAERAAEAARQAARRELAQRREAYATAHRHVEVVRRIEQHARQMHRLAEQGEEQREFDDLGAARDRRGIGGGARAGRGLKR